MTAGLIGSGTEIDPWLIQTRGQFSSVVRDASSGGYYRVVAELWGTAAIDLPLVAKTAAASYVRKWVDLNGFGVRLSGVGSTTASCALAGLHVSNGWIEFGYTSPSASTQMTMLYRCSAEDVAFYSRVSGSFSSGIYFVESTGISADLPRLLRRVVFLSGINPQAQLAAFFSNIVTGLTVSQAYVFASTATGWSSAGITQLSAPTLAALDAASANAFSAEGWWQDGAYVYPCQVDTVQLSVFALVEGVATKRVAWQAAGRTWVRVGETDDVGVAQFTLRIRKFSVYALALMEDFDASAIRSQMGVVAGAWYLPPTDNGFIYQAGAAGFVGVIDGVVFDDQPVTVDGVLFTPRECHPAVVRSGLSVVRNGLSFSLTLDTTSDAGSGVEGDPAYLDGVVEEIHPTLGAVRPLASAEVAVFERRGEQYVSMGRAFSNVLGEFRVETEVYGGGDVFAFALDFPGVIWAPGIELGIGARVRPTVNNGYVYEIVSGGVSGTFEPDWWADAGDGTEGYIGTARAKARPYYQPQAHGPLKMTFT